MAERYMIKMLQSLLEDRYFTKVSISNPIIWLLLKFHITDSRKFNKESLHANVMIDEFHFGKFPEVFLKIGKVL